MSIELTPENRAFIQKGLDSGQFKDMNEAMNQAVAQMKSHEDWLRAEIQKGLDSPSSEWNLKEFLKKANAYGDVMGC